MRSLITWAVLPLAALAFGCGQTSGAVSYQDVCQTTHKICVLADALCLFAPGAKMFPMDREAKSRKAQEMDSLAVLLREQIKQLQVQP